jgi:hypothetical protein
MGKTSTGVNGAGLTSYQPFQHQQEQEQQYNDSAEQPHEGGHMQ